MKLTQEQQETFVENLLSPKRVKTDSGEVEQHDLSQQMKALDYLARQSNDEGKQRSQLSRLGVYQITNN